MRFGAALAGEISEVLSLGKEGTERWQPQCFGTLPCSGWFQLQEGGFAVTEGTEQQPLGREQKAFKESCWPGLSTYSIRIWEKGQQNGPP